LTSIGQFIGPMVMMASCMFKLQINMRDFGVGHQRNHVAASQAVIRTLRIGMKEIRSEIEIGSSPGKVWQVLIDPSGFMPEELRKAINEHRVGETLKVHMGTETGRDD